MRVLVSGGGGFLGRYVVDALLNRGHSVRAIVRPTSPDVIWSGSAEVIKADFRGDVSHLLTAFDNIDCVLHLAAGTSGDEDVQFASSVVGTENFLSLMAKSNVKRLVHVSSLVVYDWASARKVMNEQTPLLVYPYGMGGYTIAKVWQERVVSAFAAEHSWHLTIMRPGFIWGQGHAEIAGMGRHFGPAYVMFGPFSRLPLSHVINCADCLVAAVERQTAIGEVFNVIDDDNIRVQRYVREYMRGTGRRGLRVPIPYKLGLLTAICAAFLSRALFGPKGQLPSLLMPRRYESQFKSLRFPNRKLKERLSWSPPLSFDACIRNTYELADLTNGE